MSEDDRAFYEGLVLGAIVGGLLAWLVVMLNLLP